MDGARKCGVCQSNVSAAKVYIDGVQKGSVGKVYRLTAGNIKWKFDQGYKSVTRSIDLGDASFN